MTPIAKQHATAPNTLTYNLFKYIIILNVHYDLVQVCCIFAKPQ